MIIHFSERIKVGELFKQWCKELGASPSPINMIVFLEANGLLNEEAFRAFLKGQEKVDI